MISNGFAFGYSDVVVIDTNFAKPSVYIYVYGTAGDIVYENTAGETQVLKSASLGYHPIAARRILTGGTVNAVAYTTTAVGMCFCSTNIP